VKVLERADGKHWVEINKVTEPCLTSGCCTALGEESDGGGYAEGDFYKTEGKGYGSFYHYRDAIKLAVCPHEEGTLGEGQFWTNDNKTGVQEAGASGPSAKTRKG